MMRRKDDDATLDAVASLIARALYDTMDQADVVRAASGDGNIDLPVRDAANLLIMATATLVMKWGVPLDGIVDAFRGFAAHLDDADGKESVDHLVGEGAKTAIRQHVKDAGDPVLLAIYDAAQSTQRAES